MSEGLSSSSRTYRPTILHAALVFTELLGRISPWALLPAWLALAAIACWPWGSLRLPIAVVVFIAIVGDGLSLSLLPRRRRSFGPATPPLLALALLRAGIAFLFGLAWTSMWAVGITLAVEAALTVVVLYSTWIEPFRVGVTEATLHSPKLAAPAPLRLLHISDIHVERCALREERVLNLVPELDHDVLVLTGDYLNLSYVRDEQAQADAVAFLRALCERTDGPVFAVSGSPPVDAEGVVPAIFRDLPIVWLLDRVADVEVKGHTLRLVGLRCSGEDRRDAPVLQRLLADGLARDDGRFTILLYHTPDLMPEAAALGVDLYLCGHTHGGQLRLPLFGAVVTSSAFGKRYEMGRYREGRTTLYVSRGLGMEGLGAPRARFLAPPEIVVWTLDS
jgi:hypothetical protein